jgi:hypothetical protein
MNKLKLMVISFAALVGVMAFTPAYVGASTVSDTIQSGVNSAGGTDAGNNVSLGQRAKDVVNIMLYILGAIAVIIIVFGGIRYVTSTGDSGRVKAAKDTITYAVVGLIIAILAYAIVNFVIGSFK